MNFKFVLIHFIALLAFCIGISNHRYSKVAYKNDPTLECCSGYQKSSKGECLPICSVGCLEGKICLEPQYCGCEDNTNEEQRCTVFVDKYKSNCSKCKPNYNYTESGCELVSIDYDFPLPSSSTEDPDSSSIWTTDDFNSTTICINGFCDDENSTTILPAEFNMTSNCQTGCWAGKCIDDICQCGDGLVYNEKTNDCIMPCEHYCQNGVCNQDDNKCVCNQGYVHKQNDTHSGCVPHCEQDCVNSECVVATKCECFHGDFSTLKNSFASKCLQTCEDCQNGTCVALNKCQCRDGFVPQIDNRFECVSKPQPTSLVLWARIVWIVVGLLTLLILVAVGVLILRKVQSDSYNVRSEYDRAAMCQNRQSQKECAF